MIGYLKGKIISKELNKIILNVNNVGYEIFVPHYVFIKSKLEETKELFIYTHVREDILNLYGFDTKDDKKVFLYLLLVSGVGPKTALNIISSANGGDNIVKAIQNADVDFFKAIKGIGKKTSQRIIVDLKSKIGGIKELELAGDEDQDLVNALRQLGFETDEIKKDIKGIDNKLSLESKIKEALKKHGSIKIKNQ